MFIGLCWLINSARWKTTPAISSFCLSFHNQEIIGTTTKNCQSYKTAKTSTDNDPDVATIILLCGWRWTWRWVWIYPITVCIFDNIPNIRCGGLCLHDVADGFT